MCLGFLPCKMPLAHRVVMTVTSLPPREALRTGPGAFKVLPEAREWKRRGEQRAQGLKSEVNPRQDRRTGLRQKASLRVLLFPFREAWAQGQHSRRQCGVRAAGRRPHAEAQLSAAGRGPGSGDWGLGARSRAGSGAGGPGRGGRSGSGGEERGWGPHAGSQPALCATLLNGAGVCARGLARISRAFP